MNQVAQKCLEVLKQLEVNANVQLFAKQWIDENGVNDLEGVFALFDRLHLPYQLTANVKTIEPHYLVLAVTSDSDFVIGRVSQHGFNVSNESSDGQKAVDFYIVITGAPLEKHSPDWVGERLHAFRPIMPKLLLMSFLTNVFALAVPFITMSIYDHVIGGDAGHELMGIAVGAGLLFVMMGLLRTLRSQVFASVSNRVSREISQALVQKILANSYLQSQNVATASQQNQLMLAERVSGVLSGPLGSALFDLPFVILFVAAIGILGGWLVIVPVVALLLYYVLARRALKASAKRSMQSTVAGTNRQNMSNEFSGNLAFLRSSGFLPFWLTRFDKANLLASKVQFSQVSLQSRYTSFYYVINVGATLAIMGLGIDLVLLEALTPGGLIAAMMLISKVTGPAQLLANSALRFNGFNQSKQQVNRVLSQVAERDFNYQHHPLPEQAPALRLDQVTLRYPKQTRPALSGVSFEVPAGQVVAITGPSGSGKSTLIDVIAGLQSIQNGMIALNEVNLSQYDPQLYRHWCFIRAASPHLMSLSIREWLSDGHQVNDATMLNAIDTVGGQAWLSCLPNGLDTAISELVADSFFDLLSGVSAQILIDAKALVHPYPLLLLDNPVPDSHGNAKNIFKQFINARKGKATIVFSSHDTELIKLADIVVVLEEGAVVYAGPLQQDDEASKAQAQEGNHGPA